jgi:hypothetical protein
MVETSDGGASGNPYLDREDILRRIRAAFSARDRAYTWERNRLAGVLKPLGDKLERLQAEGHAMICAEQILLEAQWLVNYRDEWPRAARRIRDLERSLENGDQPGPHQDATGSWGGCCEEWYRRLEPTVDALQNAGPGTIRRLEFMERLQDPERILEYLYRLQISDIEATGRNERDELGAVQTALSQLIFKKKLRDLLARPEIGFTVSPELEASYLDYLWQTQHPRTGYWGPWYRFGDRLVMVQDLSFTFHVIQYRSGDIPNWPAVTESTLEIKDLTYPAGWKPRNGPAYSNHNNYDVLTIFRYGWPRMTGDQQLRVRNEIGAMLDWCLTESVSGDGFLVQDESAIDTYYFGVRFLDRIGFWDPSKRFWSQTPPSLPSGAPTPHELCERLQRGFDKLNDASEEGATVKMLLKVACAFDGVANPPS